MRKMLIAAATRLAAITLVFAADATALCAQPPDVAGAAATPARHPYATVILVADIGAPNARAVVVRRPGELPNNIILVTTETTPRDLATAVSALITSRTNRGDQVDREMRTHIVPQLPRAKPTPSERLAAQDLRRLPLAPVFDVPGIGRGPALVVRMKDSKAAEVKTK
jgi:hypothetical protein